MSSPLVSIIIVNFCGKNLLNECLQSITKTNYHNYEIIIVDNNSTDDSVEFVEKNYKKIQLLKLNKNYGFAIPNNMAAKIASAPFSNNDSNTPRTTAG